MLVLWEAALVTDESEPPRTWGEFLKLALLSANLGDEEATAASFSAAYDAGFRYLWSYDCDACVHVGFYAEHGLFAALVKIPEVAVLIDEIESENAAALANFNRRYGVVDKVREMMAANDPAVE